MCNGQATAERTSVIGVGTQIIIAYWDAGWFWAQDIVSALVVATYFVRQTLLRWKILRQYLLIGTIQYCFFFPHRIWKLTEGCWLVYCHYECLEMTKVLKSQSCTALILLVRVTLCSDLNFPQKMTGRESSKQMNTPRRGPGGQVVY